MTTEHHRLAPGRTIVIPKGKSDYTIRVIGDTHQDGEGFRKEVFRKFVSEQVRDKNSVWIHSGDLCDSERPSTRLMKKIMYADRGEAWTQEDKRTFEWLDRSIIPQYAPIAESCLGMIDGDHFHVFNNGMTSTQYICRKLKIPYLGERSSFVSLVFKTPEGDRALRYNIHARHGKGCPPTHGGDMNALIRQEAQYGADLHIGGHTHKENCHPQRLEFVNSKGYIKNRICWYVRGGSMLDGFPGGGVKTYAYRKEYSPLPVGWGEVRLSFAREWHGKNDTLEIAMSRATIVAA